MVQTDQDVSRSEDQTPRIPTPTPLLLHIRAVTPLCIGLPLQGDMQGFLGTGHSPVSPWEARLGLFWLLLPQCAWQVRA